MNNTIWKYALNPVDTQQLWLTEGAKILSVANQGGEMCLWVECNPEAPMKNNEDWIITLYGTGHPINENRGEFVGTCLRAGGSLVWHVYARKKD